MITKLKRIKGLGIVSDFTWDATLPVFGRYNLIYGWNGSGKTTLSNLFAGLATGSVTGHSTVEYEVDTEAGTVKTGVPLGIPIRVFNREYVDKNVHTLSGKAKPILILGEENKKIAEAIEADETDLKTKQAQLKELSQRVSAATKRKDRLFSDIAKTIGLNTAGMTTRNYRKPDAERDFAALSGKALLDDAAVTAHTIELKQQEKPNISEIRLPTISVGSTALSVPSCLTRLASEGGRLCTQTVESRLVSRLAEQPDLAAWVERGIDLHKTHASTRCEFCDQGLPAERMKRLAAHFNEADRQLKDDINTLLTQVLQAEGAIRSLSTQVPDKANLYDELQSEYQSAIDEIRVASRGLLKDLATFRASLEDKKLKTTESLAIGDQLDSAALMSHIEAAHRHITAHNLKTANFKAVKETARRLLETHFLTTIYDEVNEVTGEMARDSARIDEITKGDPATANVGLRALQERITANRAMISSSHKGCEEINGALRQFLGRDELRFEVEEDGYVLKRGSRVAGGLSEGERTAIGVVHFIINLREQAFDPAHGIIVVDDPVSSMDSHSIFQAFAFLKNAVKDARQVLFLTHEFEFLRLLINWVSWEKRYNKQAVGYYMITDTYDAAGVRAASITKLDKLLQEHETEYHYLFKRLYTFQTDGTLESVYDVPNVARKVLESFLMFRVPSNQSPYQKLEALKPYFDENKLTAIYKFTNDQSHMSGRGFDPSLVGETQKNVRYLLEMIEAVFPEHYKILVDSIKAS